MPDSGSAPSEPAPTMPYVPRQADRAYGARERGNGKSRVDLMRLSVPANTSCHTLRFPSRPAQASTFPKLSSDRGTRAIELLSQLSFSFSHPVPLSNKAVSLSLCISLWMFTSISSTQIPKRRIPPPLIPRLTPHLSFSPFSSYSYIHHIHMYKLFALDITNPESESRCSNY